MKEIILLVPVLAGAIALPGAGFAQTDNYPSKPIRLVAPFPPGGSVDIVGRIVGARLSQLVGQQVVIDNRSGASGNIGMEQVARAAPDGYTLAINTLPFVTNGFLYSRVPYDVVNDFAPVSQLSSSASVLTVHPSVPAHSVRELIQLAKARPGTLNYGGAGVGTNPHVAGELFNLLAKTNIVVVQFKGGAPAVVAAASGEIGITVSSISETTPFIEGKRLRALGVTSLQRSVALPGVPPIADTLPGYEFTTWHVIVAPKATPRGVVTLLNQKITQVMRDPEFARAYEQRGFDIIASTPDECAAFLKSELAKWGKVIKDRGMRAD
ncbi:MAG: tripartite tricarboxylate transporter substrate binding protein [Betaproteobacteria bacterium]